MSQGSDSYNHHSINKVIDPIMVDPDDSKSSYLPEYDSHEEGLVDTQQHDDLGPPPDRGNLCYYIFFLQGVGSLFPWNAFISASFYFKQRLQNTIFEGNFTNYFTAAFQLANCMCLYLATRYQHRWSANTRVTGPLSASFIGFLITVMGTQIQDLKGNNFFYMNLVLMAFIGGSTAFLGGGLFSLAGNLPSQYTQALMGGQGLGGVGVAILLIISKSLENIQDGALLFFSASLLVIILCIISYRVLLKLPIMLYFSKKSKEMAGDDRNSEGAPLLLTKGDRRRSYLVSERSILETFNDIKPCALGVMANFAITLSVFPAILLKIQTSYSSQRNDEYYKTYFIPVFCFFGFNASDLIGRIIAGKVQWPTTPRGLNTLIALRCFFIPIFIISSRPSWMSNSFIAQDPILYLMMLIFGVTNGYYGSLCMMYGPSLALPREREVAGAIMIFFLTMGVSLGTLLSFGTLAIACLCNPFVIKTTTTTTAMPKLTSMTTMATTKLTSTATTAIRNMMTASLSAMKTIATNQINSTASLYQQYAGW